VSNPNFGRSWPRFWFWPRPRPILATRLLEDISFDPDPHEAQNAQNHLPPFGPPQIGWFIPQTCLWALENPQIPHILTTVRIKPFNIRVPNGDPHLKMVYGSCGLGCDPQLPLKNPHPRGRCFVFSLEQCGHLPATMAQAPLQWLLWQGAKFLWY
jgi:hypothetical protein